MTSQQVGFVVGLVFGVLAMGFSCLIFWRPQVLQDILAQAFGRPRSFADRAFSRSGAYFCASVAMLAGMAFVAISIVNLANAFG